jgi:large subunit ribosomal protein L25
MSTDRVTLPVKERKADQLGSRNVGRLRKEGLIPGVVYGGSGPQPIVVGERELRHALGGPSGLHAIIEVVVDGGATRHAVVKEFQRHPVRGTLTHIDLHEVDLTQPIQATVQVQLVGEARGAKLGGLVSSVIRELRVEALPTAMPDHIAVDVSSLDAGSALRLADVPAIEGITFLDDPTATVLATCSIPRGMTAASVAEALAVEAALAAEAAGESAEDGEAAEATGELAAEATDEPSAEGADDTTQE